jgi:hypothetical protein
VHRCDDRLRDARWCADRVLASADVPAHQERAPANVRVLRYREQVGYCEIGEFVVVKS